MTGLELGTVPQWGTFGVSVAMLVTLIVATVRVLPALVGALNDRMRARNERLRDEAGEKHTAVEEWRVLQAQVAQDLADCRRERAQDADRLQRQDDEIFRLRVVLSMALSELEQIDPGSQIILKAQTLLLVPPSGAGALADPAKASLDQLLEQLTERDARRSTQSAADREGYSGA